FDIVWGDPPPPLRMCAIDEGSQAPQLEHPQGCSIGFPVVIGAGSHPFPFRTRKLSLLPPMVLRGQLRGRVGHCRGLIRQRPVAKATGLFYLEMWRFGNREVS